MNRIRAITLSVCLGLTAGAAVAQEQAGTVVGRSSAATREEWGISGAMVSIEGNVVNMQTGSDGAFR